MLIHACTPRIQFDTAKFPSNVVVHTIEKVGISDGAVFFNAATVPGAGVREGTRLQPSNSYPIVGEPGFIAHEFCLPFWDLAGALTTGQAAAGFHVLVRSAHRVDSPTYGQRSLGFSIITSVLTGGGVIRLADSMIDLHNPTFKLGADDPFKKATEGYRKEVAIQFNDAHRLASSDVEARRQARLRQIASAGPALTAAEVPQLPPPSPKQLTANHRALSEEELVGPQGEKAVETAQYVAKKQKLFMDFGKLELRTLAILPKTDMATLRTLDLETIRERAPKDALGELNEEWVFDIRGIMTDSPAAIQSAITCATNLARKVLLLLRDDFSATLLQWAHFASLGPEGASDKLLEEATKNPSSSKAFVELLRPLAVLYSLGGKKDLEVTLRILESSAPKIKPIKVDKQC